MRDLYLGSGFLPYGSGFRISHEFVTESCSITVMGRMKATCYMYIRPGGWANEVVCYDCAHDRLTLVHP